MKPALLCILVLSLMVTRYSYPYEIQTHAVLTSHALSRVTKDDNGLMARLGLSLLESGIADVYYDVSGNRMYERQTKGYAQGVIYRDLELIDIRPFSPAFWLLTGAIREDDGTWYFGLSNPQDDKYGNINRFYHHFLDPVNDAPLSGVSVIGAGSELHTAAAWALGTPNTTTFSNENAAEPGRRNHFSIKDAREYMYRALTGQDTTGSKAIAPDGNGGAREPTDDAEGEQVRRAYWATTFRALGDVVHLVEDMGQPQHTRNDPHSPLNVGHGQRIYEAFTNMRALHQQISCFFGLVNVDGVPPLDNVYDTYPIVSSLDSYGAFFSTVAGSANGVANGKGLADYSNRGFFTAGTNVDMSGNNYNSPDVANLHEVPAGDESRCVPQGFFAVELNGEVSDTLTADVTPNVPLTTRGLWFINGSAPETRYSLNAQNYTKMGDLLVPRAVGYAAGLIKYFFRGKLAVTPPDEGVYGVADNATPHTVTGGVPYRNDDGSVFGFKKLRMKVRNITDPIDDGASSTPQDMSGGTLVAVARFRTNPCYQPDLSGEVHSGNAIPSGCSIDQILQSPEQVLLSAPQDNFTLASNEQKDLVFDFSANPIPVNVTNLFIDLVYRGTLGNEADAVVVRSVDMFEPTYVGHANNSDYVLVYGDLYTPADILADEQLEMQIDQSPEGNHNGVYDEPLGTKNVTNVSVYINGGTRPVATVASLPPQRYFRLAVLTDSSPFTYSAIAAGLSNGSHSIVPEFNQFTVAGDYSYLPLHVLRGYHYYSIVSIHRDYGDLPIADASQMQDVTGDALTPVQATISSNFQ